MLKRIAHFNTGETYSGFSENEDGSITKSALVFVEGDHQDNRGRSWSTDASFVEKLVENTNRAFNEGKHIPILKEHNKTIDSEIGVVNAPLELRVITEEDLPDPRLKDLIGKMGAFCDGLVIKAQDVVQRVKQGLNKKLSPGIDMKNMVIREISSVVNPAITGLAMYSEGDGKDMEGVFTLDDAEAMSQNEDELKEEFEELSYKFYCVLKNILKNGDQLGDQADMMVEKAFVDYEDRMRELFGLDAELPEEDETVGDVQRNGYSLQQAPGMATQNDYAPYSLYAGDDAEFNFMNNVGDWVGKQGEKIGKGLSRAKDYGLEKGRKLKNFYTTPTAMDVKTQMPTMGKVNWRRVGGTAVTGAGVYGAYKLGRAGLGAVGIGHKEEPKPWYRRNPFI